MNWTKSFGLGSLLVAGVLVAGAHDDPIHQELAAVDAQLAPVRNKAMKDPKVIAARDRVGELNQQLTAARRELETAIEAAMTKMEPTTKELLEKRKKLRDQITAAHAGSRPAAAPAPAPAPAPPQPK
jgi:hypothetical protein